MLIKPKAYEAPKFIKVQLLPVKMKNNSTSLLKLENRL